MKGEVKPSENPRTGLQEFSVECADEGGCRQHPTGIEVFPVTGTRPPLPPPPPPFIVGPPTPPIQPIIGMPPLPPANQVLPDDSGEYSEDQENNGSFVDRLMARFNIGPSVEEVRNWSNEKVLERLGQIEGHQITGNVDTIAQLPTVTRNGAPAAGLFLAGNAMSLSAEAGRLRQVCAERGLDC